MKLKKIKRMLYVVFMSALLHSCVCDFVNDDLKVVNNSRNKYIVDYFSFTHEIDSLKDKMEMNGKIMALYNIWDKNKVNKNNYYQPENIYGRYKSIKSGIESISTRGTSIPKYFRFYFINVDVLFENYQKGLPVDSFNSYKIEKYTREELKTMNNQIVIKD